MKNFLKKYGKFFWILSLILSLRICYEIFFLGSTDYFSAIMIIALTYYFWGLGTGRIVDETYKPIDNDEEE
tara:strand:+ start:4211 stop:4423 length:213 start_codon:yes stop_codon:yes gene_type:complete